MRHVTVAVFAACIFTSVAQAAPSSRGDLRFEDAIASYRASRYSEAFGRLSTLASRGDPDAARIVLFMHQYGPTLFGSYWDLNDEELAVYREVATIASQRKQPVFQPAWQQPNRTPRASRRNLTPINAR